jgi:hypothetical protein
MKRQGFVRCRGLKLDRVLEEPLLSTNPKVLMILKASPELHHVQDTQAALLEETWRTCHKTCSSREDSMLLESWKVEKKIMPIGIWKMTACEEPSSNLQRRCFTLHTLFCILVFCSIAKLFWIKMPN